MWDLVSVMQLDQWIKEKTPLFLVDIRDRESFETDHISGAVWMDEKELLEHPKAYLKEEREIRNVLICYHGALSTRVARILSGFGYVVYSVCGGMEAWNEFHQR